MTSDFASVLDDCLKHLAQGETVDLCLLRYREYATELEPLLYAAGQFGEQAHVQPSETFKSKLRARLQARMNEQPKNWSVAFETFTDQVWNQGQHLNFAADTCAPLQCVD